MIGDTYEVDVKFVSVSPAFDEYGSIHDIVAVDDKGDIWWKSDGCWQRIVPPKETRYVVTE